MPGKKGPDSITRLAKQAQKEGYPQTLQVHVSAVKRPVFEKSFGKKYKYFDVASLTKILVTTSLAMKLFEEKRLELDARVERYLGFTQKTALGRVKVRDLLVHHSGLVWWRPYFEKLSKLPWADRARGLKELLVQEKIKKLKTCVYSDPDYMVLGWIIEEICSMPLDEAAQVFIFSKLGLEDSFFIREPKLLKNKASFAPTEKTQTRGVIQGHVHDDNAWAAGGVAGHAGLFSTLHDVNLMGFEFLNAARGGKALWKPATVKLFTKRQVPIAVGDWGLGFMLPSRPVSTGGTLISSHAFGHTGFTGTSLWVDVKRGAVVTILSNRTFPSRKDERFLKLRRELHDAVWEWLDG